MAKGQSVPLGTILAYAGSRNGAQLNTLGWSICDGTQLLVSRYPDLFKVLGTSNGGDGSTHFNLPDIQGYFLRGTDTGGHLDPDSGSRKAPVSGGATGVNVGSIQDWATAKPRSFLFAKVNHVPNDWHKAYASSDCTMLKRGSQTCYSSSGGDAETRPRNAYVQYIIKTDSKAALPTGCVLPFAGESEAGSPKIAKYYLNCDGTSLAHSAHPDLFKAIGISHGGTPSKYCLPDYRGRFLRGVTNTTSNDPDADDRTDMNAGGNTGNAVGSLQSWSTGRPKTPFHFSVDVGTHRADSSVCAGHDNSAWHSGSTSVDFTYMGGDNESRPVNTNVDFLILSEADPNTGDIFPIGSVIAMAGATPPSTNYWARCDGSKVASSGQYAALFAAIGHCNGGDDSNFNLPDYRGRFMRGCDRGQGRDPDASDRTAAHTGGVKGDRVGSVQSFATGKPKTSITGNIDHLPASDHHNALALGGNHVGNWGSEALPLVSGGDAESRPINIYVDYYIKYSDSST